MAFDVTISIYLAAFLIFLVFIGLETLQAYQSYFIEIEVYLSNNMEVLILAGVGRMLFSSFSKLIRVLKLTFLPYDNKKIWLLSLVMRVFKLISYGLLGLILLFLPLSPVFVLKILGLYLLIQLLLIVPQWYLFQIKSWKKISIVLLLTIVMSLIGFSSIYLSSSLLISILLVGLVLINYYLWSMRLTNIDWMRVVETNDLAVWNMFFINTMSEMKIKPEKKIGFLSQLFQSEKQKRSFPYQHSTIIYRHLWKSSLLKVKDKVFQGFGSILIIVPVLMIKEESLFVVGICLSIFLYSIVASSFFAAGFDEKLVHSLPWDMDIFKRAFLFWMYIIGGVYITFFGAISISVMGAHLETFLFIVLFSIAGIIILHRQINKQILKINRAYPKQMVLSYLYPIILFASIPLSIYYEFVTYLSLLLVVDLIKNKGKNSFGIVKKEI